MASIIIEEWVAMMPAWVVRMVIDSLENDKILYLHLRAVKDNIESGYRPDLAELFPNLSLSKAES